MTTGFDLQTAQSRESERIEVCSLINLAAELISNFWPMQTFIHHNPIHGLEHLEFREAIERARRILGGQGYQANREYQRLYKAGRIAEEHITDAVMPFSQNHVVTIGGRNISDLEVLRTVLIHGTGTIPQDVREAAFDRTIQDPNAHAIFRLLQSSSSGETSMRSLQHAAHAARQELGVRYTLGAWCDAVLGTSIQATINQELIKWCGGFLDEGHAPWPMPNREMTFYGAWKLLAQQDKTGSLAGGQHWDRKIQGLPFGPEDAVIECLQVLKIPKSLWGEYFTLHLAQLPGWTGFLKWRSEQTGHEWQRAFPIDVVNYLAVRLFYERELVGLACQNKLGIEGTYAALQDAVERYPFGFGVLQAFQMGIQSDAVHSKLNASLFTCRPLSLLDLEQHGRDLDSAWATYHHSLERKGQLLVLCHIAKKMGISLADCAQSPRETLESLLSWVNLFPDSAHGPYWLQAFERSYLQEFIHGLRPNLAIIHQTDSQEEKPEVSRPLTQAIFCIDVRSEGFRRHFEEVGGNETFGFAGFFGIPICYQGFGRENETDQCPVLLKPKHRVKEVPRAYQAKAAEAFLERQSLAKTGHTLLHDLKENVITPYVMVEAIGWFFGVRLFGQTLAPTWYRRMTSWLKEQFAIPIGTTLTVDKLANEDAEEMVASQHRALIYRLLIERYGRLGMTVSHDQVERLRRQALSLLESDDPEEEPVYRLLEWDTDSHNKFLEELRQTHDINSRAVSRRKHQITRMGFTAIEQGYFVETALRIIGFTKTFARLVLVCAHGSASENNPYESALDCGACGGNQGISNARAFAAMANKAGVRQLLSKKGIHIPSDTHFVAGQHNTTTDEVELYDLEDVPSTHRKDLLRLQHDLEEAGRRNGEERLTRLPDEQESWWSDNSRNRVKRRSVDWSQVRPEWGLSKHSAFIIGRRLLTQGLPLEGRTFLHSYDYLQDPTGKYLEIIMTAPMIVGNWINMEHYFSTVDPEVYGAGSKVYHNVVGRIGVMYGSHSDLRIGLPVQTVLDGHKPYHEPMRLFAIIEAPLERITMIIARHDLLKKLIGNHWMNLVALDPVTMEFFQFEFPDHWRVIL